ncbi:MAG: D-aminoacyl-tRNA deacylase [bacterium]
MRAVVQWVSGAVCKVSGEISGEIGAGLLVFLAVGENDSENDIEYLLKKIIGLRVFEDDQGKMNLSVEETKGSILLIPQFTLYGDVRRGLRPSFHASAGPQKARRMYEDFLKKLKDRFDKVQSGVFGAMMDIRADNDGPVTILIDSDAHF